MKIRRATIRDLKKIDQIFVEGSIDEIKLQFPKKKDSEILKEFEDCKNSRRQGFKRYMKNKKHYLIVIEDKNEIIGFGQAWIKNKNKGLTESVYVDKNLRKKGAGKKIMKDMIKWLKKQKVKNIESSCYIKNIPSVKLHEKLGFEPFLVRMKLKS